jgi:hypothetical protein
VTCNDDIKHLLAHTRFKSIPGAEGLSSRSTPKLLAGKCLLHIVRNGPRVGCEVKIIAKSQQKQIDRAINDLEGFTLRMNKLNRQRINMAVVGINHESNYVGHEGERTFEHALKEQEPIKVKQRLLDRLTLIRHCFGWLRVPNPTAVGNGPVP